MNITLISGRVTKEVTVKGKTGTFTLANDRDYPFNKDQNGNKVTNFITCKVIGEKNVERAAQYLTKGTAIIVKGYYFRDTWKEDGTYKEFNINKEKIKENVWDFAIAQNKNRGEHPAVFPIKLILDHIKTWSNEGDLVLDPFMGSGTTAQAALLLNRKYLGIEINKDYVDIANENIKNHNFT